MNMEIEYKKLTKETQSSFKIKAIKCPCGADPILCHGISGYWVACSVDDCEWQPTTSFYRTADQAIKSWNDTGGACNG